MFLDIAAFRQVKAESEIVFSKKGESLQIAQGILSPLRLPVPPRPSWLRGPTSLRGHFYTAEQHAASQLSLAVSDAQNL